MKNPIIWKKRTEHEKVLKRLWVSQNNTIGLVSITDTKMLHHLTEGLKTLSANFIVIWKWTNQANIYYSEHIDDETILGCDFIIADKETSDIEKYMKAGIVPIITKKNYLSSLLSEFNPMKNEGNAYIYDQENEWQIFYALCRYIENAKFTFDNQNLINNVTKI